MKGSELLKIRKDLGLTQEMMAERIGVRPNTVARWERGELQISQPVANLIRLLAIIERDPKLKAELLEG